MQNSKSNSNNHVIEINWDFSILSIILSFYSSSIKVCTIRFIPRKREVNIRISYFTLSYVLSHQGMYHVIHTKGRGDSDSPPSITRQASSHDLKVVAINCSFEVRKLRASDLPSAGNDSGLHSSPFISSLFFEDFT